MSAACDIAVVGAGSAGCAVAARLSEDSGCRVVLLEAGGDGRRDPRVTTPSFFVALHGSPRDWAFRTEPQRRLDGRRLRGPCGRILRSVRFKANFCNYGRPGSWVSSRIPRRHPAHRHAGSD